MGLNNQQRKLFSEFPPVTTNEWEEKIKTDLKGADYEKKLTWKTDEGFDVKPYYRSENLQGLEYLQSIPGEPFFVRGNKKNNNNWMIRQDIPVIDIEEANRIAVDAVQKGADSLSFCATGITSHKLMSRLLSNIDLLKTNINFMSSRSYPLTLELLIYEVNSRKMETGKISGSLNFDPISYLLLHGNFYISKENNFEEAEYLLKTVGKKLPGFKAFTINGHYFPEAGSTIVQELAFSLASAIEYFFELTSRGISIDDVAGNFVLSLGIGSDYFLEIAKLRAVRLLWSKIVEQYHPKQKESLQIFIHSTTVLRNKALFDPYVNMLRSTTEGMAAAIGNYRHGMGEMPMFVVVPDLLDHLRATFSPSSNISYDELFNQVKTASLLVLDDLGTQSATPWAREKLYQIFNYRYNAELPTVITTSMTLEEIDPRIQSRMLDTRLCTTLAIIAPPFRGAAAPEKIRRPRKTGL